MRTNNSLIIKNRYWHCYIDALKALPIPGQGDGFHHGILRVANYGRLAGLLPSRVARHLAQKAEKAGNLSHRNVIVEIKIAVRKAYSIPPYKDESKFSQKGKKLPRNNPKRRVALINASIKRKEISVEETKRQQAHNRYLIHHGKAVEEWQIEDKSPVNLPSTDSDYNRQGLQLIESLYHPSQRIFIGECRECHKPQEANVIMGKLIEFESNLSAPLIVPNCFSGEPGPTKDGLRLSYRADSCIPFARYVCVEFDGISLAEQVAFFAYLPLPISALIFSGGKSIHAWIDISSATEDPRGANPQEWEKIVTNNLKLKFINYGADPATFNRGRLSRFPGHYRQEKGDYQRLLYLNPRPTASPILSNEVLR